MAEKQVIPNARDLAEKIAGIILRESYNPEHRESEVKDMLLFGSALGRGPAHDIDMLVIHDNYLLDTFGFATIYDEHTGRLIPHPTANIQERCYKPEGILKKMGGQGVYDFNRMEEDIDFAQVRQIPKLRVLKDMYLGELDLPHIGRISFVKPVPYETVLDTLKRAVDEKLRSKMISTKVKALMEEQKLDLNEVLDLHTINVGLLSAEKMQTQRDIIIAQCKDPTYWNTVLTTGRLYNKNSWKFEIPVDRKYKDINGLFPN